MSNSQLQCRVCTDSFDFDNITEKKKVFSNIREFASESFTVWRCPSCHSFNSQESVDLDRYYQSYPVKKGTLNYFIRCAYGNALKVLTRHGLRRDHAILDFGCSEGLFVKFLQEKGFTNTAGYDPFSTSFDNAAVLQQQYDFVVSYDVIEHCETPSQFLTQVMPLVKPGGVLLIGTPNADKISLTQVPEQLLAFHQPYHRHILSEQALIDLVTTKNPIRSGFQHLISYDRTYADTRYPGVNMKFLQSYMRKAGDVMDVLYEPYRFSLVSPRLILQAFLGYYFPERDSMTLLFQASP